MSSAAGLSANFREDLPVLFIWGKLDPTTIVSLVDKSRKFIPRLQDIALEGVGHWVMVEARDEVTDIVTAWLRGMASNRPHFKL
jgi:soluble epoxide hydrolase/lipid-phosphate phosphatase